MAWLEPEEEHFQDAMDELEDEGIQTTELEFLSCSIHGC